MNNELSNWFFLNIILYTLKQESAQKKSFYIYINLLSL